MMQTDKITDINSFISGIINEDESDFYTEICDYFNFRNLGELFDLNDLIATYKNCVDCLKSNQKGYKLFGVFCKNILEAKKYNAVQMYNFYLLLHVFFDYLLFSNVKSERDKYLSWIENQLDLLIVVARIYYYDYNFTEFLKNIEPKSIPDKINLLITKKGEYLLALSQFKIPENKFDHCCDKQIAIFEHQLSVDERLISTFEENEVQHINETKNTDQPRLKTTLTMPTLVTATKYGGVNFAAERTGYSVSHIRRLARSGKIPRHKPTKTGSYRFYADELLEDWKANGMNNFQEPVNDNLLGKSKKKKSGSGKK